MCCSAKIFVGSSPSATFIRKTQQWVVPGVAVCVTVRAAVCVAECVAVCCSALQCVAVCCSAQLFDDEPLPLSYV